MKRWHWIFRLTFGSVVVGLALTGGSPAYGQSAAPDDPNGYAEVV